MNTAASPLPPGQHEIAHFPRFGLTQYAARFPAQIDAVALKISGDLQTPIEIGMAELARLPRLEQCSDFHCVTTWTRRHLRWGGVRFQDFFSQLVLPLAGPAHDAGLVVLRGQDGARTSLPLADLMAADVLLADQLDGQPLTVAHGAPLRLVAPGHYGYKSVKHLDRIEFWRSAANFRPAGFRFMDHPRARVAAEERGQWVPGWLLRRLYRPLIGATVAHFERALRARGLK